MQLHLSSELSRTRFRVPADQNQLTIIISRARAHTHTDNRGNRREHGETRGKTMTADNRQRGEHTTKQAQQRKEKGGQEETQEPDPTMQKANSAKQNCQQKHGSETTEAGQHREETNTLLRG